MGDGGEFVDNPNNGNDDSNAGDPVDATTLLMLTVNPDDRDRLIDEIKNALGSSAVVEPDPSNDSVILVTLPKSESDAAQTDLSGFTEVKSVEVRASETTRDEIAGTTDSTVQEDEGPSTTLIALLVALAAFLLVALCAIAVAAAFKKKK